MDEERAQKIIRQLQSGYGLPHLSPVAMKLVELASDDRCSASQLALLIEKDPSLATTILRQANSPAYRPTRPITSLHQAVVRLGFQQLRITALALSLRNTFPMGRIGPLDYETFWRLSLYRAILARFFAQKTGAVDPQTAFASGLILEIGLLILFDLMIRHDSGVCEIRQEPLEQLLAWEQDRYGVDHRQIGAAALRFWGFPETIVACQDYTGAGALHPDAPGLARINEVSRAFSTTLTLNDADFSSLVRTAGDLFGLDEDAIVDAILATLDQVDGMADELRLEMSGEKDLVALMEKANKALIRFASLLQQGRTEPEPLPSFASAPPDQDSATLQAVAHEIRNPLMVVGAFARKLSQSVKSDSAGGRYARVIQEEALRLEKVLAQMTGDSPKG